MSPKTRNPEDRREIILDTAMQLWIEKGFEGMRLDVVAKKARVSKGTLYQVADNKLDLAFLIMQRRFDSDFERIRLALSACEDPVEILRRALHDLIPTVREDPGAYAMEIEFFAMAMRHPHLGQRVDEYITPHIDQFKAELSHWVDLGIEKGSIRPDVDAKILVDMTHAWGHLMWHEWITHKEVSPDELRRRTDHFMDLLFRNVRAESN